MSALGIAGSLAGTAVKTAVNRSINQYQERRLDQQSKVDWCVRAIPDRRWGPPLGTRGSRALTTTTADGVSVFRRHADASATTNPRRAPAGVLPPARRFSRKCASKRSDPLTKRIIIMVLTSSFSASSLAFPVPNSFLSSLFVAGRTTTTPPT
jgi:hypothetical protein